MDILGLQFNKKGRAGCVLLLHTLSKDQISCKMTKQVTHTQSSHTWWPVVSYATGNLSLKGCYRV